MILVLFKTLEWETGQVDWFLVSAQSISEAMMMVEDDVTKILESYTTPSEIAVALHTELGGMMLGSTL